MRSGVRRALAIAVAAVVLPACGGGGGSQLPTSAPPPTTAAPPAPSPTPVGETPPPTTCSVVPGTPSLTSRLVTGGLDGPVDLQASPGDRSRLYVVEQAGRIRVVRDGVLVGPPFLDIVSRVGSGGERGLLGLAFHPRSADNGRFFVNYTDRAGDTHIAEFRVSSDRDRADPASERTILLVRQPDDDNHKGGGLAFGLDGMLYIGLGDGGSSGDPRGNGQNLGTHLGKMLRVNIDQGSPYSVPSDNPFVGRGGALPEIWAYGLRNPWRFAFDRETGDLYIGDVGQEAREEVDVGVAARRGGENYGWNTMEGTSCFHPPSGCSTAGLTLPVFEYPWGSEGLSVVGGIVYRGCRMPGYHGLYFFSDYFSRFVRSFRLQGDRAADLRDWTATLGQGLDSVSSFGVDADGEMYILDHQRGSIYKIVPEEQGSPASVVTTG